MNKKLLISLLICALFLLPACSSQSGENTAQEESSFNVAATTWPVYCFASDVTSGADGVTVTAVINQPVSCLHDYTLSVNDMKRLENADLIAISGAGLEDFMDDALASSSTPVVDCSLGITLLDATDEEMGDYDPHIWMDPTRCAQMVENLVTGLSAADPDHADLYRQNGDAAEEKLLAAAETYKAQLQGLSCRELITFHNGFHYFADAFDLTILKSMEEEAGSEASAQDINEIISLIQAHQLPAIFTEVYGSDATAQAIARETGVNVYTLSMLMSGPTENAGVDQYLSAFAQNIDTLTEALG